MYVSPIFRMMGNECIKINLESSDNIETSNAYEQSNYNVQIRYYFIGDLSVPYINESIKGKVDKLRKHLIIIKLLKPHLLNGQSLKLITLSTE